LLSDYISASTAQVEDDAGLLASYALMLLRIFPRLGEEIRMWLYQGSITLKGSGTRIPAVKLFWRVMSTTSTFYAISNDSKSALSILHSQSHPRISTPIPQEEITRERDWRAILLFLELYAFVLRFTDDEEFLSGGSDSLTGRDRPTSRSRDSALPLQDVKLLTIFLKNLSFTMYFNASEILGDGQVSNDGLGSYFGTSSARKLDDSAQSHHPEEHGRNHGEDRGFLGIPGMTFNYVRSIVTRVMRMLYERDSRRRFLPRDHWLMTSHFDMEGFIPAVVMEEERRHEVTEEDEEVDEDNDHTIPLILGRRDMVGMQRSRHQQWQERLKKKQQKVARKKMLASIAPRLEILQNMPYAIPFATRVQIFRQFVYQDQVRRRDGNVDPDHWRMSIMHGEHASFPQRRGDILSRHHAKIRRDQIFEDAYEQFYDLGEGLKEPIQITFVDRFDTVEAGIDGGGVTKEFLTSVTNEAFHSSNCSDLFVANDQNLLYPNPAAIDEKMELLRLSGLQESSSEWKENLSELLRHYEFLGRIIGKCLYEGILVDIAFAGFFLLKWATTNTGGSPTDSGYLANINDLRDLDESLYQGLLQLKNYPGDVSDFALDFTINDTVSMPGEPTRTITRPLLGTNMSVTNENRVLYVSCVARHRLHNQPYQQTRAFLRGLWEIINPSWLSMFNQAELQTLIGGDSSEIDVDDLRRNTIYSGVYEIGDDGLEHPTIQIFWDVMKKLDDSDRRKVLKYVTSTPRGPLLGFSQLNPRFSIRDAGSDQQRLPSTSTCINLLKLPRYQSSAALKQKLLYAVNSGAGFDLS
jgi:ubiquitin-protein ligase E3 C